MVGILRQTAPEVTHRMLSLRPLPAFQDNYIWTLANEAGQALIVDPGEAGPVLAAIEITDSFGQKSLLRFSNVELNVPVAADAFRFTPPQGVDVIEQ